MKKFFLKIIIFVFCLSLPFSVWAHPGRTDANGCHVCRTNCEEWGLEYGEYHYHTPKIKAARTQARNKAR